MKRKNLIAPAIAAAIVAAALGYQHNGSSVLPNALADTLDSNNGRLGLPDFTGLVSATSPAVVNISVARSKPVSNRPRGAMPRGQGEMPEFFKRFGPPMPDGNDPIQRSGGSGFIISADGNIVTNAHVVADAEEINVHLSDKRQFKAKVIGVDQVSDVALIKIEGNQLPTLKVGDPAKLKVGEWVIAIGSPFGFDNTVSAGVVSAKMRSLPNGNYVPFIQTDVAINPGNSGGPLLNLKGEVVGINSQIYSESGGYMGLSFAIPIDVAMDVQNQLAHGGKVQRGRLGVSVQTLDQDLARSFGMETPQGALVNQVQDNMPAAKAGIKAGDVILKVDGAVVEDSAMLSRLIASKKPGQRVAVELRRNGKPESLSVALGEMTPMIAASDDTPDPTKTGRLGVVVQPLDEAAREGAGGRGVLVTEVAGAAARAGIRPGDVILAVNSAAVQSPADLKRLVSSASDRIALLVHRDDAEIFVPVTLG
jgi:serine protease Do